ncbi:helix-turn-helix domain-containing protein [Pseudoduganella namucuonensis]|uniref:AraC-type DNA-binding protein n=1 Tax=Pseudoduganella namucuonensis TaxID=1035707 RepID=A0A1I7LHD6_9BURK|nr:helix-turn-helix transcriptional regulator [Pseudoduganella namucuonensis]SFV09071.1 AraC-type DNA-binding protein [Pseudoduganella namucuonensis]
MQHFYKKALVALIFLVLADLLLASFFIHQSFLTFFLLPADKDGARWHYRTYTDVATGGSSTILSDPGRDRIRFDFKLTDAARYPYVATELMLDDQNGRQTHLDWSKYTTITFLAKCAPSGSMTMVISTFDDKISKPGKLETYPSPGTYFSCNRHGVPVSLDITRMFIPEWWLSSMRLDLSQQGYILNKVAKIVFGTGSATPRNVDSYVEISDVILHGRDYRYIAALLAILLASCGAFALWFFRAHTRALAASLESKLKKDLPLVAYRQLTLEPYKDKEKALVLRFIATNYTNANLDLDAVVAGTGANRHKVNEVLKAELGMTFSSYLNKLRLTEAARLLAEKGTATMAEIAYSVGYASAPYFNKLFKEEYGCTPKSFRSISTQQDQPAEAPPPEPPGPSVGALG